MPLTRDAILKADDIKTEEVAVPEWGGTVLVRGMSGRARDELEASMLIEAAGQQVTDRRNASARIASMCIVDEAGKLLFSKDDIAALGEKSSAALNRVFAVASRLSGLSPEDMKELTENFGAAAGGDSPSSSPNGSAKPSKGSSAKSAATN